MDYRRVHGSPGYRCKKKIDETFQEIAWNLGGQIIKCDHREYGSATMKMNKVGGKGSVDALFQSLGDEMQVCTLIFRALDFLKKQAYL